LLLLGRCSIESLFSAKANDLIEKIGQQMISDEFQSAIDFAEPMTETGFLPDQIRKRK
jgi:hypothetical protein